MTIARSIARSIAKPIVSGIGGAAFGLSAPTPTALQSLVLAGGVTPAAPLVPIGDSHTDDATSAHFIWDRLQTVRNQPGEGLEGVASTAIVPMGNNGQTLANYLTGAGTNNFAAAMALNPSVVLACWLTNDVRLGGLGLTVDAIRTAGVALLNQLVADIKAAQPSALIVLRVPAPYLTVNVDSLNFITDGVTVNPPGLAQIYTSGVRAAHYAVRNTHPDVLIYDPQARLFGTTSPTSVGTYFANQIHQNQAGYEAEGDDFATWVNAAVPYDQALTDAALVAQPFTPWLDYSRSVEDASRFVLIGYAPAVTVTAGNAFEDFGPTVPNADPTLMDRFDLIENVGAESSFFIPAGSTLGTSAANTRISFGGGFTVPVSAVAKTKVRVYRQTKSGDTDVNTILAAPASFRRTGRISAGSTTFMDVTAYSLTSTKPTQNANQWVADMLAGDKVYVEGFGATPITLTSNFSQSGNNLRLTGLSGTDWNLYKGRIVVVYRA